MIRTLAALLVVPALLLAETPVAEPVVIPSDTRDFKRFEPLVVAGDGFLVAWEERFEELYPAPVMIRAYDADGQPHRSVATAIPLLMGNPRVVWTGSEYLLVGAVAIGRFGGTAPIPVIVSMRIRPDGTLTEDPPIPLVMGRSTGSVVSLTWDGREVLAYFYVEGQPRLLRLTAQGRIMSDESSAVATRPVSFIAAPGAGGYVLRPEIGDVAAIAPGAVAVIDNTSIGPIVTLFEDGQIAEAFLLAPRGIEVRSIVLTDGGIASMVHALQFAPSLTSDAEGLLVAWIETGRIRIGRPGGEARFVEGTENVTFVRIAQSLLVWVADGTVWAKRIDVPGVPLRLGNGTDPVLVTGANGWLVAWRQDSEIVSTLITPNGDPTGLEHFGAMGVTQVAPQAAATPSGFVIAWAEEETVGGKLRARPVAESLDANGRRVSGGVRLADLEDRLAIGLRIGVGCGATNCLVTWSPDSAVPIGFDARPLGEVQRGFSDQDALKFIVAQQDGTFDIYNGAFVTSVRADGTRISFRRWTTESMGLFDLVRFQGTLFGVHLRVAERSSRVFVRDLAMRRRAVRH